MDFVIRLNPEKCHYLVIGSKDSPHKFMLRSNEIIRSNNEKLLGIFVGETWSVI